jgi:hypothetical protein
MIFWLVMKLEISYNRVIIYVEGFWLLSEEFFRRLGVFVHGEIFEFP